MIDDFQVTFSPRPELFFVNDQLVATQASYNMPYCKENYHEVRHFYCGTCGNVWGVRIAPDYPSSNHHFYRSLCSEHGGKNDMLNPFEWENLDILGPEVLAYQLLQQTQEVDHE